MLADLLVSQIFASLLVFCRLGTALMVLPGFGETYVLARARLLLGVMFSIVVAPTVAGLPPVPSTVFGLFTLVITEILVGLFIGGICRLLIATIHIAGMIIAYQAGLSSALTQDVAIAQSQGTAMGNLLSVSALVLIFVTDMHHLMLRGMIDSYTLFLPGHLPMVGDMTDQVVQTLNRSFNMGTQIAGPMVVMGLVIHLIGGVLAKLMPNIQIFFILPGPQLLLSFFILMVSFSAIMMWYMDYFKDTIGGFLAP
jgi:flagellar biosynthesis protein FliR